MSNGLTHSSMSEEAVCTINWDLTNNFRQKETLSPPHQEHKKVVEREDRVKL